MAEPREGSAAHAAIAHAHDAQPRDSHLRQPRAGFFRVQADRKGGDFLPAHSPRVWARCVTASAARCVTATVSVAVLRTDCLRKIKPR